MLSDNPTFPADPALPAGLPGTAEFRARTPIRVDLSALSMMDQVLMKNYLRQLSARHEIDWVPVADKNAEVSIDYHGELIRIRTGNQQELLPHPIRITQLDPTLQRIARHTPAASRSRATLPATVSELLLPTIKYPGPLRVSGKSFGDLYFDKSYRYAWSAMAPEDLHRALAQSQTFDRIEQVQGDGLRQRVKAGEVAPVSIESLCWAMDTRAALADAGGDGFAGEDRLRLTSWPNLAWQADFESWLPVLVSAASPIGCGELSRRLVAQGIPAARVAEKLRLLWIFRRIERGAGESSHAARHAAAAVAAVSAPNSMFGRLRSRLRAMLAAG